MPIDSLQRLLEGNKRFAERRSIHTYASEAQQEELLAGQRPFATVFGCADSRVPVELIFDQGLGDLFVIRNAGHIVGESVLGSMEFAVTRIHCPLVLVLGHSHCGAVTAAVEACRSGAYPAGHIASIARAIEPVAQIADTADVDAVMRAHVVDTVRMILEGSPTIAELVKRREVGIVAAEYRLATRTVHVLSSTNS